MKGAPTDPTASAIATAAARAADGKKANDTVVLAVGDILAITECFVITSASNTRLVRTIVDEVEKALKEAHGRAPRSVEGLDDMRWVLLDYGDLVVHVFLEEAREFYALDRLWADAPELDWRSPTKSAAG